MMRRTGNLPSNTNNNNNNNNNTNNENIINNNNTLIFPTYHNIYTVIMLIHILWDAED